MLLLRWVRLGRAWALRGLGMGLGLVVVLVGLGWFLWEEVVGGLWVLSRVGFRFGLLGGRLVLWWFLVSISFASVLCRASYSSMVLSGGREHRCPALLSSVRALLVGIHVFAVDVLAVLYLCWSLRQDIVFLFVTAAVADEGVHGDCGVYCCM